MSVQGTGGVGGQENFGLSFEPQPDNAFITALNGSDFTLSADSVVVTAERIQATVVLGAGHTKLEEGRGRVLTDEGRTFVANQLQGISPQAQALATELFESKTASQVHVSGGQVCKIDLTNEFKQRQVEERKILDDQIRKLEGETAKAPRKHFADKANAEYQKNLTELEDLRQYKKFTEAGEQLLEQLSSDRVNFDEASKAVAEMEKAYKALEDASTHMLPALAAKYKNNDEGDTITALYHLLHHNWRPEEQLAIERSSSDFAEFKEGLKGLTSTQSSPSYRPTSVVPQGSSEDEDSPSSGPSSLEVNHLRQKDSYRQRKALEEAPPAPKKARPKTAPPPPPPDSEAPPLPTGPAAQIPTAKPAQTPGTKPGDVTLKPVEAEDFDDLLDLPGEDRQAPSDDES